MRRTGGTIAVTAGLLGTLAAVMTLVLGLAGALEAETAIRISWSEWGALVFSFATMLLGAICMQARSASAGLLLMMASVCGAVVGSAAVAMYMSLAFAGGGIASLAAAYEEGEEAGLESG